MSVNVIVPLLPMAAVRLAPTAMTVYPSASSGVPVLTTETTMLPVVAPGGGGGGGGAGGFGPADSPPPHTVSVNNAPQVQICRTTAPRIAAYTGKNAATTTKGTDTMMIVGLIIVSGALIYLFSRTNQRSLDERYGQLKALPPVAKDFTTPEGAILLLEDAYRRRDIEAAIAAKDFNTEAKLMLQKMPLNDQIDDALIEKTAQALMLSFRRTTTAQWPNFDDCESFFTKREPYAEKVVVVTEVCRFRDHRFSTQRLLVAETDGAWRVLNPLRGG
jgi:hypothetical protein